MAKSDWYGGRPDITENGRGDKRKWGGSFDPFTIEHIAHSKKLIMEIC